MATHSSKVDRSTTVPFHLKLFYRVGSHLRPEDFPSSPNTPLPPHLQIYTWSSCTLRELSHLLTTALPSTLPSPAIGTRLVFRLIFPDPSSLRSDGPGNHHHYNQSHHNNHNSSSSSARYISKDLGSVVIGGDARGSLPDEEALRIVGADGLLAGRLEGEPDKSLGDARFVIGDYVACAVLPPGRDGEVQGSAAAGPVGGGGGGRMRAFPEDRGGFRDGRRGGGFGGGGFGRGGGVGSDVPAGEWRRGERVPDSGPRYGRRGGRY